MSGGQCHKVRAILMELSGVVSKCSVHGQMSWHCTLRSLLIACLHVAGDHIVGICLLRNISLLMLLGVFVEPHYDKITCSKHTYKRHSIAHPWLWGMWCLLWINSHPPGATYMHLLTGSALVQIMVCRLFGAKLLPQQMLNYSRLDP